MSDRLQPMWVGQWVLLDDGERVAAESTRLHATSPRSVDNWTWVTRSRAIAVSIPGSSADPRATRAATTAARHITAR